MLSTVRRNLTASKLKPLISLSPSTQSQSPSSSCFLLQNPPISVLSTPTGGFNFKQSRFQSLQQLFFSTAATKTKPQDQLKQTKTKTKLELSRDGNFDESTPQTAVCPGCGIHMQHTNPKYPGYFSNPTDRSPEHLNFKKNRRFLFPVSTETELPTSLKKGLLLPHDDDDAQLPEQPAKFERPIVCTRCHSLRHYGKVKDPSLENLMPDFDFNYTVGRRLASISGTRSLVLMVVDATDFDGSFPGKAAKVVLDTIEENYDAWKKGKSGNVPRVVLVVTKIDLLPASLSPTGFEHWVRQRAREGGVNKITKVHFVSSVRNWGLKDLVEDVVHLAGPRGQVWAIGAQNAGKSTLLNAMGKHVASATGGHRSKIVNFLTEAPVPGTTLGIVRLEGVLPGQAKLFDTPGLLHPHQITTRLNREEQKLVHISKEVNPRTYRITAGHTIHIAGLMRLDVEELSVDSIYVTVWASPHLPLHMGKTENAHRILQHHFGRQLQPPIGPERVIELGKWVRQEFSITGNSWDSSSVDVASSGLGWFVVGLKGEAVLGVWTYEGVDVILRNALLPYRSKIFEEAGFTVSEVVSKADQALNNLRRQSAKKKNQADCRENLPMEPSKSTVEARSKMLPETAVSCSKYM